MRNPVLDVTPSQKAEIEKLITRIKGGDKDAFQDLYDITWKPVYYMLLKRIGDEADALILLNQIYAEVYANLQRLENGKAFMKWVTQIMFAESMNFLKERYKFGAEELLGESIDVGMKEYDDDLLPENALINKEEQEMILQTVEALPDTQRETIFMFYYHNLSVAEIADITSSTENTVYKRLHDAKKTLKTKLSSLLSSSTLLYNVTGLGFLREVFQRDIEAQAALVSKSAIWVAPVAANALVAASAEASAGGLVKVITSAAAKSLLIKTVIVSTAAVGLVTVAVTLQKTAPTPIATENLATPPPTDTVFSEAFPTKTPPNEQGSDMVIPGISEVDKPEIPEPEIMAEVLQGGDVDLEGEFPVREKPAAGEMVLEPEATEENSISEPSPRFRESAAAVMPIDTPPGEVIPTDTPPGAVMPVGTPTVETPATPEAELPQEELHLTESARSENTSEPDTATPSHESVKPEDPVIHTRTFRLNYEMGSGPVGDGVINDLAIFSGRIFNPETDTVTIEENGFDPYKAGEHIVRFTAVRGDDGNKIRVEATVVVADTKPPVINVENPVVTVEQGTVISAELLLEYAGVSVTDNSGEFVLPEVEGYENIDFQLPGQYELSIGAKDAQGNEAFRRVIIFKILKI